MEINNRIEDLLEIARLKLYTDNALGKEALQEAYDLSQKYGYEKGQAWSLLRMGSYAYREGNRYIAIEQYKKALLMMNKIGDCQGISRSYYLIATVYSLIGEFDSALDHYLKALKLSETYDQVYHFKILNNLGVTYYRLGQYDHGLRTIQSALEYMLNHDIPGLYIPYTTLGEIYLKKEAYKEALECAEKALEYLEEDDDTGFRANADIVIAAAFKGLHYYDESLIVYNRALKSYDAIGETQNLSHINRSIAEIYLIKKEYHPAFEHCQRALTYSHKYESLFDESKVYHLYAEIYEELNDFEKAYKYIKSACELKKKINMNITKKSVISMESLPSNDYVSSEMDTYKFDRVIGELTSTYESESYIEKSKLTDAFVEAIIDTVDMRDTTTAGHSKRIAFYSTELLKAVSKDNHFEETFTENDIKEIYYAALLHDIGKLSIRENILLKKQRLSDNRVLALDYRFSYIKLILKNKLDKTDMESEVEDLLQDCYEFIKSLLYVNHIDDDTLAKLKKMHGLYIMDGIKKVALIDDYEFEHLSVRKGNLVHYELENMRTHATMTKKILENIPWLDDVKNIPTLASSHHEKLDGTGYPKGLSEHDINTQMRILSIVDIFEALTASDRPYKPSYSVEDAIDILRLEVSDGKLDGELVEFFVSTGLCYKFKSDLKSKS